MIGPRKTMTPKTSSRFNIEPQKTYDIEPHKKCHVKNHIYIIHKYHIESRTRIRAPPKKNRDIFTGAFQLKSHLLGQQLQGTRPLRHLCTGADYGTGRDVAGLESLEAELLVSNASPSSPANNTRELYYPWRIHGAGFSMLTWLGYIAVYWWDPCYQKKAAPWIRHGL